MQNEENERRIAVLIETSTGWGAGMVNGIADFLQQQNDRWHIFLEPRGKYERLRVPLSWKPDGIIARVNTEELAEEVRDSGIPCVNVSWYAYPSIARCTVDERECGRLAAQYYLDKYYTNFAYCGSSRRPNYVDLFGLAFSEVLQEKGHHCHNFQSDRIQVQTHREERLALLSLWLNELPRPCGLLTVDTETARQLVEAAQAADFTVPDDFAVLAGDYDELAGRINRPNLSMIDNAAQRVGFHSAELLDRILKQKAAEDSVVKVAPTHVNSSQSTDWTAIADPVVVDVLRFIRDNFHRPIQVADLVEFSGVSRRLLEQRFAERLSSTPNHQIQRMRLDAAKRLLEHTELQMPVVAARSGFASSGVMCRVFNRLAGLTPSEYREQTTGKA